MSNFLGKDDASVLLAFQGPRHNESPCNVSSFLLVGKKSFAIRQLHGKETAFSLVFGLLKPLQTKKEEGNPFWRAKIPAV